MNRPANDPAAERYLDRVRASLGGVPASEVEEIVRELRSHLAERSESEGGVQEALRSLGDPVELARQYRAESVTARAECTRSPLVIIHSLLLLRRGRLSRWTALALAGFGFAWSFVLLAAAVEKVLSPGDVGLWYRPGVLALPRITVDGPGPAAMREMLGWWFVPAAAVAGAVLFLVTRHFAQWWIRRARADRSTLPT